MSIFKPCARCKIVFESKFDNNFCPACEEDEREEEFQNRDPDYYICNCCGFSSIKYYGGWGCPKCTAIMEEGYY